MNNALLKRFCDRCGVRFGASTMSRFNRDMLCMPCLADEKKAPNYPQAEAVELAAVRAGDFNYQGIGLAPEDLAFLEAQRRARETYPWESSRA